jgi:hypothetical protein
MILNRVQTLGYLFDNYTPTCHHWISATSQIPQLYWHRDTVLVASPDLIRHVYDWSKESGKINMPPWAFEKLLFVKSNGLSSLAMWVQMHFVPNVRVVNFLGTPSRVNDIPIFHHIRRTQPLDLPEIESEISREFTAGNW